MSSYFYFTRHGQTIWNVENKICGATDIALTSLGHDQAIELGKRIKEEHIHIDEILYSPLVRAADTAKHISEVTGIACREEIRLKEQNFGRYESTARDGEEFAKAKMNFVYDFDGGGQEALYFLKALLSFSQAAALYFLQLSKAYSHLLN